MMNPTYQLTKLNSSYTLDEKIVVGLVLAAFISVYVMIAALAVLLAYLVAVRRLKPILVTVPGGLHLAALSGLTCVVSLAHRNIDGLAMAGGLILLIPAGLFVRNAMTGRLFESALDTACAASLFSLLVIVIQLVADPRGVEMRAASTFMNANNYAAVTEFVILICVYKLTRTGCRIRVFHGLVLLLNLIGLYLSNCRTAIPAVVGAVLVFLLISRQYKTFAYAAAVALLISAALFALPGMQNRMGNLQADVLDRITIWRTAVKGIYTFPIFGQGGGAYTLTSIRFGGPLRPHAHNLLLDPLLNFGVAGVALLGIYLKANFLSLTRMLKMNQGRSQAGLAWAAASAAILHGITDSTLFNPQLSLIFLMIIGAAGIIETKVRPAPAIRPAPAVVNPHVAVYDRTSSSASL